MRYYIDYPGLSHLDPRTVDERLHETFAAALAEAKAVYAGTDAPKVIVAEFPLLLRVATICGDRSNPRVLRRRRVTPTS